MKMRRIYLFLCAAALLLPAALHAQKYQDGVIDKSVAVVGEEMIKISTREDEVKMMRASGMLADKNMRCELLERMIEAKIFLMQARIDSLSVNNDMVESELSSRIDELRFRLGGDEGFENYFGKPIYKLRQEWRRASPSRCSRRSPLRFRSLPPTTWRSS